MAQVQTPTVVRPVRATRAPATIFAVASLLLVVAIALAMMASGTFTSGASINRGDFGTREWTSFRSGERAPLGAPGARLEVSRRAAAEGQLSQAGIHGSLAGTSGSAVRSSSVADALLSGASVDLRRCERDLC